VSRVPELIGLSKEKNERALDRGDAVYSMTHLRLTAKNIKNDVEMRPIYDTSGRVIDYYLYQGSGTIGMAGTEPDMQYLTQAGLPDSVANFDRELWEEIRRQSDTASVAMGDDDVSGGRITGPVTAYRMWPTMSATQVDRVEYSTALRELSNIILRIFKQNAADLKASGHNIQTITDDHLKIRIGTEWPDQIPIEVTERNTMLVARLAAGGISILDFLKDMGVRDYQAAADRVWADYERKAKIDAKVKLDVAKVQAEAQQAQAKQQLQMNQQKHDQGMAQSAEKHKANLAMMSSKSALIQSGG
jgi:hypothetical protein